MRGFHSAKPVMGFVLLGFVLLGIWAAVQPGVAQRVWVRLEVGLVEGNPGDTVAVPVTIDPSLPVGSFGLDISYDVQNLEFQGYEKDGTLLAWFFTLIVSEPSPGVIHVTADRGRYVPIESAGVLLRLRFLVRPTGTGTAVVGITGQTGDLLNAQDTAGGVVINALVPTPTPPVVGPPPVVPAYRNTLDGNDWETNGIQEIAGTFAGLAPARIDITGEVPIGDRALGTRGNALRFSVQPEDGSLVLFGKNQPVASGGKSLARMCVWSSNASAQIFVGLIETDMEGNLTGSGLGMDQLTRTAVLTKTWRRITVLHECESGFVVPFVQVVGGLRSSEVYIDNVEVYVLQRDAVYSGGFLGVDR